MENTNENQLKGSSKAIKTKGLHEWTKDETILAFYLCKFGNKLIYLKNESEVAKFIGVTTGSLKMQIANFNHLMGSKTNSLSDFSKLQEEVFDEFNGLPMLEFNRKVRVIINQDHFERIEALKKLGKDVRKMKLIPKQ